MDSRAQFEEWHREKFKTKFSAGQPTRDMHNGKYSECYTVSIEQERWQIWQASRAAIEVALPRPVLCREFPVDELQYRALAFDVEQALTREGIRFKMGQS